MLAYDAPDFLGGIPAGCTHAAVSPTEPGDRQKGNRPDAAEAVFRSQQ